MLFFLTNFKNKIAFFLTLLYIFSFIPKTNLHNLVANHADVVCNVTHGYKINQENLSTNKGFHCFLEDCIIKSPAIIFSQSKKVGSFFLNILQIQFSTNLFCKKLIFKKQNRGPPIVAI